MINSTALFGAGYPEKNILLLMFCRLPMSGSEKQFFSIAHVG